MSLQPNPFCLDKQSALAYKLSNPLTSSAVATRSGDRDRPPRYLQSPQIRPDRVSLPKIRVSPSQLRLYPSFGSASGFAQHQPATAELNARNHRLLSYWVRLKSSNDSMGNRGTGPERRQKACFILKESESFWTRVLIHEAAYSIISSIIQKQNILLTFLF